MDINNHFGVYGVCYRKNKLLCIEKMLDLIGEDLISLVEVKKLGRD